MSDLVLSSSALSSFRRCPKQYELGYVHNLSFDGVPGYVSDGADFHAYAAQYANCIRDPQFDGRIENVNQEMYDVFIAWLNVRGNKEFLSMQEILHIEEPVYTLLNQGVVTHDQGGDPGIDVWLRTTFDLVYRNAEGWIVCRDYKTFEKMPSNLDKRNNFQMKSYVAALMKKYKTGKVMGEHVYVRRVPPGTKNSKGFWSESECYVYEPIILGPGEIRTLWAEARATAEAIVRAREQGGAAFWRTDLDGDSPHLCGKCFMRDACQSEMQDGMLDLDFLLNAGGYSQREPLELPKDLVSA